MAQAANSAADSALEALLVTLKEAAERQQQHQAEVEAWAGHSTAMEPRAAALAGQGPTHPYRPAPLRAPATGLRLPLGLGPPLGPAPPPPRPTAAPLGPGPAPPPAPARQMAAAQLAAQLLNMLPGALTAPATATATATAPPAAAPPPASAVDVLAALLAQAAPAGGPPPPAYHDNNLPEQQQQHGRQGPPLEALLSQQGLLHGLTSAQRLAELSAQLARGEAGRGPQGAGSTLTLPPPCGPAAGAGAGALGGDTAMPQAGWAAAAPGAAAAAAPRPPPGMPPQQQQPWQQAIAHHQAQVAAEQAANPKLAQQEAARLEASRRKNREAQQRFRERQRAQASGAVEAAGRMAEEIEALRRENAMLAARRWRLECLLRVREEMLLALGVPREGLSGGGAAAAAPPRPAAANGRRPPSAAAAPSAPKRVREGASSPPPSSEEEVEVVPGAVPPADPRRLQLQAIAKALHTPAAFNTYWRQWQVDARFAVAEARGALAAGGGGGGGAPSAAARAEVEASFNAMSGVWAINNSIYPDNFKRLALDLSMPDGGAGAGALWRRIAGLVVDDVPAEDLTRLRRLWGAYRRRCDRVGADRATWQAKARAAAAAAAATGRQGQGHGVGAAAGRAAAALAAGEAAGRLEALAEEEWHAITRACLAWSSSLGSYNTAVCNAEAEPHLPNWLAITREVLAAAVERGRLLPEEEEAEAEAEAEAEPEAEPEAEQAGAGAHAAAPPPPATLVPEASQGKPGGGARVAKTRSGAARRALAQKA